MKKIVLTLLCAGASAALIAKDYRPSVAIVIDSEVYPSLVGGGGGLDLYSESIRVDGKNPVIIEDRWNCPDSIRNCLKNLYENNSLEGAVFVGDIPVPMVRDAQHLTTAFKMDQSRDWKDSSVPSDRFYDDFDLKFDALGQDEDVPLYFYYSLRADSPQYISSDIYSARIRPPHSQDISKAEAIDAFLKKAAEKKAEKRVIDRVLHFAGHGYNSDSYRARIDESWALKHQFPQLGSEPDARLDFINFDEDKFIKPRLIASLSDSELDLAILHHHGMDDTQYLSEIPGPYTMPDYVESIKRMLRTNIRDSRNPEKAKADYVERYGFPDDWFDGVEDSLLTASDEAFSAALDMVIKDVAGFEPQPPFVMLDACFNGSFHLDDYISGHYVFNDGGTVAVKANSVNTLQDIWSIEMIGLLDYGVCIGNWVKEIYTLESHIIGDPTYSYASCDGNSDLDFAVTGNAHDVKYWKKLMAKTKASDVRCLCLAMLARNGAVTEEELMSLLKNDSDPIVRCEAYNTMKKYMTPNLAKATEIALGDNYELLVRLSAAVASKSGHDFLLPQLLRLFFDPKTPERVFFQVRGALGQYDSQELTAALDSARTASPLWPEDGFFDAYKNSVKRYEEADIEELKSLNDTSLTFRKKRIIISPQRNKCQSMPLETMFSYLESGSDKDMRLLIAETLGWYVYSFERERIIAFLNQQAARETDTAVKNEILKSVARLTPRF